MQRLSSELLGLDPRTSEVGRKSAVRARAGRTLHAGRDARGAGRRDRAADRGAEIRLRRCTKASPRTTSSPAPWSPVQDHEKTHDEGFGSVFMAAAPDGRQVTLKVLRDAQVRDRRGLQRFLTAQRALKAIDHPAVQRIVAVGVLPDGRPYLAAEHIDGQLLSARLCAAPARCTSTKRGPCSSPSPRGSTGCTPIGIMHSDLRTEHVVLVRKDNALSGVLVDFAVDRLAELAARRSGHRLAAGADRQRRRRSHPSARALAAPADVRSDVYALGALAYEMLTGKPVFAGTTPIDLIVAHVTQTPEAPSKVAPRGWVAREVDAVVLRALAKDPAERHARAGEFVKALNEALQGQAHGGHHARRVRGAQGRACSRRLATRTRRSRSRAPAIRASRGRTCCAALRESARKADDRRTSRHCCSAPRALRSSELGDLANARARSTRRSCCSTRATRSPARRSPRSAAPWRRPKRRPSCCSKRRKGEHAREARGALPRAVGGVRARDQGHRERLVAATQALSEAPGRRRDLRATSSASRATTRQVERDAADPVAGRRGQEPRIGALRCSCAPGAGTPRSSSRPDFAVACFTQALALEPGNDAALEGAAQIYRKAQQWAELVAVLLKRADAQSSPARAREYRAEAADLLESSWATRRSPRHPGEDRRRRPRAAKATQALERIFLAANDWQGLVAMLEKKAEALTGRPSAPTRSTRSPRRTKTGSRTTPRRSRTYEHARESRRPEHRRAQGSRAAVRAHGRSREAAARARGAGRCGLDAAAESRA